MPDLPDLYRDFRLNKAWHPDIPTAYITQPQVPETPTAPVAARAAPHTGTVVMPGTPVQPTGARGTFIQNQAMDAHHVPWQGFPRQLCQYLRPTRCPPVPVPKTDAGAAMCLSWHHIQGTCNSLCGRSVVDHRVLTALEVTQLTSWCQANLPVLALAT